MKERLREKPPKRLHVNSKWDMAYWIDMPYVKANLEIDLSNLSPRTHTKLMKMIDMYPTHPGRGYGWASECNKIFRLLSKAHGLPEVAITDYAISFEGLDDQELWKEVYELCYADATAQRMSGFSSWGLQNLTARKDHFMRNGQINYRYGERDFYRAFMKTSLCKRVNERLRAKKEVVIEEIRAKAAYGGLVRLEVTY